MDEVDAVAVSKVPESITKRNWILQGLPPSSSSSVYTPSSNSAIVPTALLSGVKRANQAGSTSAYFVSAVPAFSQTRFRSLSSRGGVSVMEKINQVNDLNERISETYHRRHGHSSDSENASGSTKAHSFSRRATLLVDQSFSFIDNELTTNGRGASENEPASTPSSEGASSPSTDRVQGSATEKTDGAKTDDEDELPRSPESSNSSARSDKTSSAQSYADSCGSTHPSPNSELSEEAKSSTSGSEMLKIASSSVTELILRCTSDDGEVCAVYEKRPSSPSPNVCNDVGKELRQEEDGTSCHQSQRHNKRGPYQVSFDDRIVVVDGNDAASTFGGSVPQSDHDEGRNLLHNLKKVLRRVLRKHGQSSLGPEVSPADITESRYTPNNSSLAQSSCQNAAGENAAADDFGLERVHAGYEFTKSYFDLPTVCDRLKINPLYEENAKTADALSRSLEHYYSDLAPPTRCQWNSEALVNEEESARSCNQAVSSYRPVTAQVHSKADERLRKDGDSDRFLDRFDFDQLRTKKFGVAVTIMVIILALVGIGIGLTIYLD